MKKKKTLIKLFLPLLAVIIGASVFTGCTFSYDEETDLSQVILEINPVTLTYEVPVMTDLKDPDGKVVTASVDYDRSSDTFGEKVTEYKVQTVKRTHDGDAIRYAKTNEAGDVLYLGENEDGDPIQVEIADDRAYAEQDSDGYYLVPAVRGSSVYNGEEYEYVGTRESGTDAAALWRRVSDGEYVYGALAGKDHSDFDDADLPFVNELPEVTVRDSGTVTWTEYQTASETATFDSAKEEFFKVTMQTYFENYAQSMITDEGKTVDEVFDEFIKNFYLSYLTGVEADAAIRSGDAVWGLTEINEVNKTIYDGVDTALSGIYEEIAGDFDQTWPSATEETESDTTYPTPEDEDVVEGYESDYELWLVTSEPERIPGKTTTGALLSMQMEGMRRFVQVIEETIADDYAMNAQTRADYEAEIADMTERVSGSSSDITALYEDLWTYDVIYYLYGESQEYTLKTDAYRTSLGKDLAVISERDNKAYYEEQLASQMESFTDDIQNYYTAASGSDTLLYFADTEYFWVKHILIPLSDEQTAALEDYSANHSDAEIKAFRQRLGENVTVYKHVDGEDDTSRSYTIEQAFSDIYSKMASVYGSAYDSERMFNSLIYTYNTDPGIFPNDNNDMGYAVTATSEEDGGAAETYMIEFATEARALLGAYKEGTTLLDYKLEHSDKYEVTEMDEEYMGELPVKIGSISAPALTDYGWHIMYLCVVPTVGPRAYDSYTTPGRYQTIGEAVAQDNYSTTLDNIYQSRREAIADKYSAMDGVIVAHKERFQGRLDEYADLYYTTPEDEEEDTEEETTDTTTSGTTVTA